MRASALAALVVLLGGTAAGCILISRGVTVEAVEFSRSDSARVSSPAKAHLLDGSIVVYPSGLTVARNQLIADAWRYAPTTRDSNRVSAVPLDSVIGVETFREHINPGRTINNIALATSLVVVGAVALTCANDPKCFGSCPTIYADSAGTPVLEAEGFSYSISPLLEARDVDRLRVKPDDAHLVRLQVWNEALETHYINHLELIEARHAPDEMVVPDERNRPVAVRDWLTPGSIRDRASRDLRETLSRADGVVFRTDDRTLAAASTGDMTDHLDVTVPRPATRTSADSLAVVLRMRNSLLNTELFYDFMLARPGARSIDWMAGNLSRIDAAAELGRFYARHLGLRIQVRGASGWREVTHLTDYGPIAWRDVAALLPASAGDGDDSLRIRLSFLSDQWRIDRLAVAARVRRPSTRTVGATSVVGAKNDLQPDALAAVRRADEQYLVTTPRQRFTIAFDVGPAPADSARTFFLASQGWYAEWVRGSWMTGKRDTTTFTPSEAVLLRALHQWRAERDSMERQFFRSRIPVL